MFGKLITAGILAAVTFVAFGLAVGYAPVFVPVHLFSLIGAWYFGLLGIVAALTVGLALGLLCGLLYPERAVPWALACSGSVAAVYLIVVFAIRADTSGHVWWTPLADALLLVGAFTFMAAIGGKQRHDTI